MTLSVDATSHLAGAVAPSSPVTWSHTCNASATKLLVLNATAGFNLATRQIGASTYNAVSLGTRVQENDDGTWVHTEIFQLNSPSSGANTVSQAHTGIQQNAAFGISFLDAHGTLRSFGGTNGTSANPAINGITTVAGDIVVGVLMNDNATGTTTPGGTPIFGDEDIESDTDASAQYVVATGTSTNLTWTQSSSGNGWAISYAVVQQLSAGSGAAVKAMHLHRQMRT